MQSQKIENDIKELVENFSEKDFIYDFLLAFGFTKMTIKRLREGNSNLSKKPNQLIVKQKLFYEFSPNDDIYSIIEDLKNDSATYTHKPRFIIVNNTKELLAIDTKTQETLAVELKELYKNIDFFMPWTGKEKYIAHQENPTDVKAAEKMARIYDEIVKLNPQLTLKDNCHSLNIFLTRLLFCFFAEDTGIFEENQFTKTIVNHTEDDGSNLAKVIEVLFESLDKRETEKVSYPSFIQEFPYVNGKLFTDRTEIPILNAKVRTLMIECGNQDWKEINPDIFGSMFQAVSVAEVRSGLGQHYTSVPNIMKVIEPLFLNDLKEEFEKAATDKKLRKLLDRIYNIKIFDPACGSGNFLIIAYKQLRLLEMEIIKKIQTLPGQHPFMMSQIQLNQFYGIEIDDFACEIATLSLWLAEHQMNKKFKDLFGDCKPPLPLSKSGNIVCGNATRIDWEQVCPKGIKGITKKQMEQMTKSQLAQLTKREIVGEKHEIYILGNPPFDGSKKQSLQQKEDIKLLFEHTKTYKNLDYVSCWFYLAKKYINNTNAKFAFVATNSITQGQHIGLLWPYVLDDNTEINFAYQSFKWTNNAKNQAGVTCVIIGIANKGNNIKYIYKDGQKIISKNITPYLRDELINIHINKSRQPISNFPIMEYGNMPLEGNFLKLNQQEKDNILEQAPNAIKFVRPLIGGDEFLKGKLRYCIWINDNELKEAMTYPCIAKRIAQVRKFRESGGEVARTLVNRSHQFRYRKESKSAYLILPCTSSERRDYMPCGFIGPEYISLNSVEAIYNAPLWIFGVVTSRMHMVWVRAVAGKLETRLRYSAELCYNTFPFPNISDKQKKIIEMHVNNILAEREKHSDKTMAELYDPDKMPKGLRDVHHSLDLAIDKCYRSAPFENDEKRLEHLFKRYEIMTDPTKQNNAEEQLSLL